MLTKHPNLVVCALLAVLSMSGCGGGKSSGSSGSGNAQDVADTTDSGNSIEGDVSGETPDSPAPDNSDPGNTADPEETTEPLALISSVYPNEFHSGADIKISGQP